MAAVGALLHGPVPLPLTLGYAITAVGGVAAIGVLVAEASLPQLWAAPTCMYVPVGP